MVRDCAGNAHGVFGVGDGGTSGNQWLRNDLGWFINFSNTGTGTIASVDLPVGNTSGSGSPESNQFSFLFRIKPGSSGGVHGFYGGAPGTIELRLSGDKIELLKTAVMVIASSASTLTEGVWQWAGVTYDGSAGKIFIGNRLDASASNATTFNQNSQYYLGVADVERFANGSGLQHFCVFNRAVSDVQMLHYLSNPWQIFEPETIPLFFSTITAQYARPTSDVSAGTWTASTGSDLFAMLDETAADDGDYITSTTASTCEVALGSLSDPALSTGHIVRYRISATGGGITVRLREGTTTIASWTHDPAPASLTTYSQTLSSGEADSITDYTALKLQFEAT